MATPELADELETIQRIISNLPFSDPIIYLSLLGGLVLLAVGGYFAFIAMQWFAILLLGTAKDSVDSLGEKLWGKTRRTGFPKVTLYVLIATILLITVLSTISIEMMFESGSLAWSYLLLAVPLIVFGGASVGYLSLDKERQQRKPFYVLLKLFTSSSVAIMTVHVAIEIAKGSSRILVRVAHALI